MKIFLVILSNTLILYSFVCLICGFLIKNLNNKIKLLNPDKNLIRATYPNYKDLPNDFAKKLFEEYAAPGSKYSSFVGYRRNNFSGEVVNIDRFGFRKSINHEMNNSFWFLGGSTMWGTGSDDKNTIPSIFAKITNEPVLNLGESGFNSFQELIQLQILLAQGYNPKMVIFYDGVNDGGDFCKNNKFQQLQHAYTKVFTKIISDKKKLDKITNKQKVFNSENFYIKIKSFYLKPLEYINLIKIYDKNKSKTSNSDKIKNIKLTEKYLFCDDPEYAKKASNITISSWINSYLILKDKNIPVKFILQPTSHYYSSEYELGYLINLIKKQIVNEQESYIGYYQSLKQEWHLRCKKLDICDLFVDLSEIFFNVKEPIFIDTVHISPNGNKIIAEKIVKELSNIY